MATIDNLKEAFAGESQAGRRYTSFARKAEAEGFPQIAKLFRAAAEAEAIHAAALLRLLKGLASTAENLQVAMAGEAHEFQSMYPGFLRVAEAEKNAPAAMMFRSTMAVEQTHHRLYSEALAMVQSGKDLPAGSVFVCPVCGHTVCGDAPDRCPVCNAAKDRFIEIA